MKIERAKRRLDPHSIILQLVDEGKISLEDTIDQVIQEWLPYYFYFTIPYIDEITIRNLLEMQSGMGNYSDNGAIGHGGDYSGFYTAYAVRYKNYDFAVLVNGKLQQTGIAVHVPARNVFWDAAYAIGLDRQ